MRFTFVGLAWWSLIAYGEEFVVDSVSLNVNNNSLKQICLEVSAPGFARELSINAVGFSELEMPDPLVGASVEFKEGKRGMTFAKVKIEGLNEGVIKDEMIGMIRLFVLSRCIGLTYELSKDRALLDARFIREKNDRLEGLDAKNMCTELSQRYMIPEGLLRPDSSLRSELGIAMETGIDDYVLVDGGLILWFQVGAGSSLCIPVDRRCVANPGISRFVRENQAAIGANLRGQISEIERLGRDDGELIASELKLFWKALREVCKPLNVPLVTADMAPDFDSKLIVR